MSKSGTSVEERIEEAISYGLPDKDLSEAEKERLKDRIREWWKVFPFDRWPTSVYELEVARSEYAKMKAEESGSSVVVELGCPVCGNVEEVEGLTEEERRERYECGTGKISP